MKFHLWGRKTSTQTAKTLLAQALTEADEAESELLIASDRYAAARAEAEYTQARVARFRALVDTNPLLGTNTTEA